MIALLRNHPRLLFFGILTAFFSGPGQTFLISLFIPEMRNTFGLSQAGIAGLYSAVTLLSAMILPLTGRILDRSKLIVFCPLVGVLLVLGCFTLSQTEHFILFIVGLFLVRNIGQGTLTMISSTTMARLFGGMRGKALGISNLGYPLSEAILPFLVSLWILNHGWRTGWLFLAGLTAFILIPLMVYFLWRHDYEKIKQEMNTNPSKVSTEPKTSKESTVLDMLRDIRFYVLIIPMLIPPTFFTGLFFHQVYLMEWKGWGAEMIAVGFIAFGVTRALASFIVGPLIDKYTAKKIFAFNLIPFMMALFFFLFGEAPFFAFVYLGLSGVTMGLGMTMSGALYAELFGVKSLGSIKGVISSLVVFSTAISPVLMGFCFDQGLDPRVIIYFMIGTLVVGTSCAWKLSRM